MSIKIFRFILPGLLLTACANAQHAAPGSYPSLSSLNYVMTWDPVKPDTARSLFTVATELSQARMTTQYVDGLGRPLQTVMKKGSLATGSAAVDMVDVALYDGFGRQPYKYLPFVSDTIGGNAFISDGSFKLNPFQQQAFFMNGQYGSQDETYFYSQTDFENSALGRPAKILAPGNSWVGAGRGIENKYWVNTVTDSVRIWTVTDVSNEFGTYSGSNLYAAGSLYKNVTADEHGKQVIEFKDKAGLVLLKKVQLTASADTATGKGYAGWLNTYYIYDQRGRLRAVIQPAGVDYLVTNSWTLSSTLLNEQCFRYEYDQKGRMIRKKVPGAGPVWMVYDARDRLVLSQDSVLRTGHQWLYNQYDVLDRPSATGLITDNTNYNSLAYHSVRADTSIAYPKLSDYTSDELTHTFYDDYSWRSSYSNPLSDTYNTAWDSYLLTASNATWPYAQANTASPQLRGMVTGSRVKVLGSATYLYNVNFYDYEGRLIQVQSQNASGGTDIATTQFSWNGHPLLTAQKQEKAGTNSQTVVALSRITYDSLWRVSRIDKKVSHSQVSSGAMPSYWTTISENEYDALGQLKKKKLAPAFNSGAGLDTLTYDYNIRGWLLGVNRDFVKDTASTSNWFGFDLGYDKTAFTVNSLSKSYANAQYNDNIGGMLWRSTGDDRLRKYDFTYDGANRILGADFNQFTNTSFSKGAGIDFSMTGMSYDANGNILSMNQRGWKPGGSQTIDSLLYTYTSNTNKLLNVLDRKNDTATRLGDFRSSKAYMDALSNSKTTAATDYSYDVNGNLTQDKNKDIGNIHYNYLNLPDSITVTGKGKIIYQYDASGAKLKKTTTEGSKVTTTLYLGGAVFQNDTLQFLAQEEGRIRRSDTLVYDYMLKDHLGNVRMMLTTEKKTDMYPAATMETAQATTEEALYANLPETRVDVPTGAGYPANTPSGNLKVAKVGAGSGLNKMGPSIVLKVMAGDTFNVKVNSWWKSTNTPSNTGNPLSDLLAALNGGVGGITAGHGGPTVAQLTTSNVLSPSATSFLNSQTYTSGRPKAYLNWVLLDEQFNYVAVSSGFEQVGSSNAYTPHNKPGLSISKNGYLYIYVSNVTDNIDVFFDNLQVTHVRGPLLEETHYYPFGLAMAGISSKALIFGDPRNKEKTFQSQRSDDELGLNWIQFKWRNHNPQIGRFIEIDPLSDKYVYNSPYAFSENEIIVHRELEGLEKEYIFGAMWREAGINSNTEVELKAVMQKAADKAAPVMDVVGKIAKYSFIIAGIATGNPVAIILGIPSLGLTASQDVALAIDPNNKTIQQMPTSVGGAMGAMVDKTKEAITGEKSEGTFQAAGDLLQAASNIPELVKKPIVDKSTMKNLDKVNIVVEIVDKVANFVNNLFGGGDSAPVAPSLPTTLNDDRKK